MIVKGRLRLRERPGAAPGDEPQRGTLDRGQRGDAVRAPAAVRAPVSGASGWHVDVTSRDQIDRLARLIDEWPGEVPVVMHVQGRAQRVVARRLPPTSRVRGELERIFAPQGVRQGLLDAL